MVKRLLVLALVAAGTLLPCRAETPPEERPSPPTRRAIEADATRNVTPGQAEAVARGLAFLASRQEPDGSWSGNPAPIAVTSLATLAFLAGGNTESRGRYAATVRRGLAYLLSRVEVDPRAGFQRGYIHHPDDDMSRLHGHAYAVLALAEAYGGMRRDRLLPEREKEYRFRLELAVRLIERSQERRYGGWYYEPRPTDQHEGSVTVCQIQALRSAHHAGIRVDPDVVHRAIDYVRKSQAANGGFIYALNRPNSDSYALTAAAVSTLNGLGDYGSDAYRKGIDYLLRNLDRHLFRPHYFLYANFYAAQAMWQADPRTGSWRRYWPPIRRHLLENEARSIETGRPTGRWEPADLETNGFALGPDFGTATACLILQIPYGYLPLFQR
jgi:hypothetical protein